MAENEWDAITAIRSFSKAIATLRRLGVVKSKRYTGEIGEWYAQELYKAPRAECQTQKGWDLLSADGDRLQVKTQSFDPSNRWNYLGSDPEFFDRLIVVILNDDFTIRLIYDVPTDQLRPRLRIGSEKKPSYHWDDLEPWRVDPSSLPGYQNVRDLIRGVT